MRRANRMGKKRLGAALSVKKRARKANSEEEQADDAGAEFDAFIGAKEEHVSEDDYDDFEDAGRAMARAAAESDGSTTDGEKKEDNESPTLAEEEGEEEEGEEEAKETINFVGDLSAIKERIAETIVALNSWRVASQQKRWKGKLRADVVSSLCDDACAVYGYSRGLAEYFFKLFSPSEAITFFEAVETPRPIILRANLLITRRRDLARVLIQRGANVDPLADWTKVGLRVIESSVPVGATPEYCAGHYMMQAASSFLSVMALAPQPGELVADMAAAPGGKSTYIGQLMKNKGVLFCNDLKRERCTSLVANLHRMGIRNSIVVNLDGRQLQKHLPKLDRVLLDAPCSGLGIVSRDPSVKFKRTIADIETQSIIQRQLLAAAVDLVDPHSKTGGVIVYSTCSVAIEENEAVVNWLLNVRDVKIVPLGCADDLGTKGFTSFQGKQFHPSVSHARRLYPHVENFDGFFVCKIKKISDDIPERAPKEKGYTEVRWGPEMWEENFASPSKGKEM